MLLVMRNWVHFSSVRRWLAAVAGCLLLLFSAPVFAEWYRVEVVLFAYTEPDAGGEWWYENPGLPARTQSIGLIMHAPDSGAGAAADLPREQDLKPYLALPKRDYLLAGVSRALARSGDYRPLLHIAWQQPGLDRRNVRAVRLDNTRFATKTGEQAETGAGDPTEIQEYTPPVKVFDGTVRLRKSRFLHIDVDFAYFPDTLEQPRPDLPEPAGGYRRPPADYVRLTESRRIKPNELNYFDHPLFGLLVEVRRIEIQE